MILHTIQEERRCTGTIPDDEGFKNIHIAPKYLQILEKGILVVWRREASGMTFIA